MLRIAILGNYATQFLNRAVKNAIKKLDKEILIYEAEYNTIDLELLDLNSGFYSSEPDFVIIHESDLALKREFYHLHSEEERENFHINRLHLMQQRISQIQEQLPLTKVLYPMLFAENDMVFGNYFSKQRTSWYYQIIKYNSGLLDLSSEFASFALLDSGNNLIKTFPVRSASLTYNSDLHFTIDYLNWLSEQFARVISAHRGQFKKCLILDLDNTLWGGIIGDDGLNGIQIGSHGIGKAYTDFQKWIKELQKRGVILAVCSKNEEANAKSPFEEHSEMVLKLDDIAVFVANWESKADNINLIKEVLNIGFDAMVFVDDNPAERAIVREFIPEIIVPELPEDPAEYLNFLINSNLFETTAVSENDKIRTRQYQEESRRVNLKKSVTNMDDFLNSLNMEAILTPFREEEYERLSQLSLRSNQFNLRTKRYSLQEIKGIAESQDYFTLSVSLKDKFGDYGLISMVVVSIDASLNTAAIDTWIMSCRVLKRNVEDLALNCIVSELKAKGVTTLKGEYLPTAKNNMVSDLLPKFGFFELSQNLFELDIINFTPKHTYINES